MGMEGGCSYETENGGKDIVYFLRSHDTIFFGLFCHEEYDFWLFGYCFDFCGSGFLVYLWQMSQLRPFFRSNI